MSEPLEVLRDAILGLDEATPLETTEQLLAAEVEPQEILETGMTAALRATIPSLASSGRIYKTWQCVFAG